MNDIEKAIMQLKELEIWCQDTSKIKESINLAIEALESQERLKIRLERLKNYNKYDIMLIQNVIVIVEDCIVEVENESR